MAGAGGGAESGGTTGNPAVCDGIRFDKDAMLDISLDTVTISGTVTLNGGPIPESDLTRGYMVFVPVDTEAFEVYVAFPPRGPITYSVVLPAGRYNVRFESRNEDSGPHNAQPPCLIACGSAILRSGLSLTSDGTLDIDIPTIEVSGRATFGGAAVSGTAATIELSQIDTWHGTSFQLSPGAYTTRLVPGRYRIGYANNTPTSTRPPVGRYSFATVDLSTTQTLNIDVPPRGVLVTGTISLNGTPAGRSGRLDGSIKLVNPATPGIPIPLLWPQDFLTPTFSLNVVPGSYRIDYVHNDTVNQPGAPVQPACVAGSSTGPCTSGTLVPVRNLTSDTTINLDLRSVTISGNVTLKGSQPPDATDSRGQLIFKNAGGSVAARLPLKGPASYAVSLLAGMYDVSYQSPRCGGAGTSDWLCTGGIVARALVADADRTLDVDLSPVTVTGHVTVNGVGSSSAESSSVVGILQFAAQDGSWADVGLHGADGGGAYSVKVWPGKHDISYRGSAVCVYGTPLPPTPCAPGLVATAAFDRDASLDIDVPVVTVTGVLRRNGAVESPPRGIVIDFLRSAGIVTMLETNHAAFDGTGNYVMKLVSGTYQIHNRCSSLDSGASGAWPCLWYPLAGCPFNASPTVVH